MCMSDGRKYRSNLKEHKISVKLSMVELEKLDDSAANAGVNRSRYIRELIRGNGNIDFTFPEDRANLIRQVSGIATNINQIAKYVNTDMHSRIFLSIVRLRMPRLTVVKCSAVDGNW